MEPSAAETAWIDRISAGATAGRLAELVEAGGTVCARGIVGSSPAVLAAALRRHLARPILLVTAHLDDADEAADELEAIGLEAVRFPAMELLPGETTVSLELLSERLTVVRGLLEGPTPAVITAPVHALMQAVPGPEALRHTIRAVRVGDSLDIGELAAWLTDAGYSRVNTIESPGEFAVRGDIVDVFGPSGAAVRLDWCGSTSSATGSRASSTSTSRPWAPIAGGSWWSWRGSPPRPCGRTTTARSPCWSTSRPGRARS
jgi:transcription-repair coupling factor (superfamily II helicase)